LEFVGDEDMSRFFAFFNKLGRIHVVSINSYYNTKYKTRISILVTIAHMLNSTIFAIYFENGGVDCKVVKNWFGGHNSFANVKS
jgi:hypothetical protein